jgi:glucose/arabinose dehydrogenase
MLNRRLILLATVALAACAESAKLPSGSSIGPDPTLPVPRKTLIPTVDIAPAVGWPVGARPAPAPGLDVNAYASGLVHPRWLHVLPNGDVLVAESNAPPKEGGGIRAWIMKMVQ